MEQKISYRFCTEVPWKIQNKIVLPPHFISDGDLFYSSILSISIFLLNVDNK